MSDGTPALHLSESEYALNDISQVVVATDSQFAAAGFDADGGPIGRVGALHSGEPLRAGARVRRHPNHLPDHPRAAAPCPRSPCRRLQARIHCPRQALVTSQQMASTGNGDLTIYGVSEDTSKMVTFYLLMMCFSNQRVHASFLCKLSANHEIQK